MTKFEVSSTKQFNKDLRRLSRRHFKLAKLKKVIKMLANDEPLPASYKNHKLSGKWTNHYECHIAPDWLLVYKKDQTILVLTLTRTGTHSDIF